MTTSNAGPLRQAGPQMRTPGLPDGYDAAAEAKRLLRSIRAGALATNGPDGFPFASLVNVATAVNGAPILLLSALSVHTTNLETDGRASLLLAEQGKGDPLAHPRLTLVGKVQCETDEGNRRELKRRFLARHLKSAIYADFGDFDFWVLQLERAHLNGGFAKAAEFDPPIILTGIEQASDLVAIESDALDHMNADHADTVALYATALLGLETGPWLATGIDPDGLDLACGDKTARLDFPKTILDGAGLRAELADLAVEARRTLE